MPIELDMSNISAAALRVVGVGGAGGNAVRTMIARGLEHVEFIAANTDSQALMKNPASIKLKLGRETTRGLGAGANPEVGRAAVEESIDEVRDALVGSDMVFVTAGMGGGTGTGAAPIIARVAREIGALVVAIVTKPFSYENNTRMIVAEQGIKELRENVDALIVIPNDRIISLVDATVPFGKALEKVDEVLLNATKGIADIIMHEGIINVDFADVVTVMRNQGDAMMGIGTGTGDRRAMEAAHNALNSPILEGMSIWGAKGLLVNITGGASLTLHEVYDAISCVQKAAGEEAHLIHGVVMDDAYDEEVSVTVVATGFPKQHDATPVKKSIGAALPNSILQRPSITVRTDVASEPKNITLVQAPSEHDSTPTLVPPPANVDTRDIEVPTVWRKGTRQGNIHAMPSVSTSEPTPLPKVERSTQDRQMTSDISSSPASKPATEPEPPSPQPEAFPRVRVKVGQSGSGSSQPSFLRKIMD